MAEKAAANEAQFHFFCGDIEKNTFEVAEFSGTERISCPYQFDITLISQKDDISPDKVIGQPASFYILRKNVYHPFSGLISEFQFVDKSIDYSIYRATLVPKIWLASLNYQTRIFQKMTIKDIFSQVLSDSSINNLEIKIQNNPEHEYIVQYQESDLNFICRLMEENGIWYFFKEPTKPRNDIEKAKKGQISEEKLHIVDSPQVFEDIASDKKVLFRSTSGMFERSDNKVYESISQVTYEKSSLPKDVFVKNYNYRRPEEDLIGKKPVKGGLQGTVYEYGGMYKSSTEADAAASILSKRIQSQQIKLSGTGDCRAFKVGYRFELTDHFRKDVCQPYVILGVSHAGGNFTGGRESKTYQNQFKVIPVDQANNFAPEKRAIPAKVNGILSAHIEANNADYATIDDKGRYKVRFPFDLEGKKNDCTGSKYVRLAQPYSGTQYGFHFPSHQGAEMVLACIDGDPSKPMGIGTIPNANTISPVVESNKQQNIIRTAGGNELLMDDTDKKQVVQLRSSAQNVLRMDDEKKLITVQSTDKNMITIDDTNKVIKIISNKHMVSLSYADDNSIMISTEGKNIVCLDDKNKKITVQTGGGHQIDMDDNGKKIILADGQGKNSVTLDGNNGIVLDTKGKLSINAAQDIEIKGANIKMSSNAKMDLKATQDLSLAGLNISQKANVAMKLEGVQLEAKGSATVKLQGAMTELKGDASMNVSSGGMMTIGGLIVKIN